MTEHERRQQLVAEKKTARIQESFVRRGGVDLFLWRGSTEPTPVQRCGAWLIGLFFALVGVQIWSSIRDEDPLVSKVILLVFVLLGAKVFRNGFKRRI